MGRNLTLFVLLSCITLSLFQPIHAGYCDFPFLGLSGAFTGYSCEEVLELMGTELRDWDGDSRKPDPNIPIPASFDWRDEMPDCMPTVRNQGNCGSCWAFSASLSLATRFCINGQEQGFSTVVLSPQDMVDCDGTCFSGGSPCQNGCNGGFISLAWEFLEKTGISLSNCYDYKATENTCRTTCDGSSTTFTKYQAFDSYSLETIEDIQRDIIEFGPVQAAMTVYEDFMEYSSGVYEHSSGREIGGHAINIIGWGNENGKDYWLIENSWGTSWGINGYGKFLKGSDHLGIESYVAAGRPKIEGVEYESNHATSNAPSLGFILAVVVSIIGILF